MKKLSICIIVLTAIFMLGACTQHDFSNNKIIIILTEEATLSLKEYTVSDFSDVGAKELRDLTMHTWPDMKEKIMKGEDIGDFRRILCITLKKKSRQNVLNKIDVLKLRPDVQSAQPNYIYRLD